ncbi:hypothetical protein [Cellulosimicrobium cellulans]|uniref:hypothetical protein n=1 Tax=Cellulosimicrobium cellulans TaxID=1710 RepID=UPI002405C6E2|nr:hypothetical protein [Cellulosimicrobium cellulans]MDF9874812.1 hypothetical protein [Cellulosimicrobium cellulans]
MTTPTTDPTTTAPTAAHLPAGHDDETNRWYIDPELRPHYRLATPREVREHYRSASRTQLEGRYARAELRRRGEYGLPDAPRATRHEYGSRGHKAQVAAAEDYEAAVDLLDRRLQELADAMTPDDEAWLYHLEVSLRVANSGASRARLFATIDAQWARRHTCDVCGGVEPSTTAVQLDVENGSVLRFGEPKFAVSPTPSTTTLHACFACTHHLARLVTDDLVLGRERRDVVRDWLDAHLDAAGADRS